jgi:hypothetical protein
VDYLVLQFALLPELKQFLGGYIDLRHQIQNLICLGIALSSRSSPLLCTPLDLILLALIFFLVPVVSPQSSTFEHLGIFGQTSLFFGLLELQEYLVENFLDDSWRGVGDIIDLLASERDSYFFEDFVVESVPVVYLFVERVGRGVVMELDNFGVVVVDDFGHHDTV